MALYCNYSGISKIQNGVSMKDFLESLKEVSILFVKIIVASAIFTVFSMVVIAGAIIWLFGVSDPLDAHAIRFSTFLLMICFCGAVWANYESRKIDKEYLDKMK